MRCAIFLFFVAAVNSQEFFYPRNGYSRTPLGDQIDKASVKILKEAYLNSKDTNVVTSPLGVLLLLSFYSSATLPESRSEIMTLLGSSEYKQVDNALATLRMLRVSMVDGIAYDQLTDSYTSLSDKFSAMDSSYMTLANKIYVDNDYTLAEKFLITSRSYQSEVDTIDFSETNIAAATINQWAEEKTKGHITTPVSEKDLDTDAVAALFNIIFFQGHWHVPFKAEETKDRDFHVNRSITIKKPMMHLQRSLFYHEDKEIGAAMIELPYKESGFRMVVVLPNEADGLASVLEKIAEKGLLDNIFSLRPSVVKINLHLPKFDIKSKHDLKSILPKLGVKRIFYEGAPGVVNGRGVMVSKFFQEAIVKIDEEGATAGAFTGSILVPLSETFEEPRILDFIVDHPFLFAILHEDVILFTGVYSQ